MTNYYSLLIHNLLIFPGTHEKLEKGILNMGDEQIFNYFHKQYKQEKSK